MPKTLGPEALASRLFVTANEAAALLRWDARTVRNLIHEGDIPAARAGNTYRIPPVWKAYRVPATLYCSVCGKPVSVRRRPSRGRPVYCRDKSRCKVRAFQKRKREQVERAPVTVTASQIPEVPVGPVSEPTHEPSPAELWLAMRAGSGRATKQDQLRS
jgi:excisionase family DNA binding protein